MRKMPKKVLSIIAAATLSLGALAMLPACSDFEPLTGDYSSSAATVSNGGFIVEKGNYYYFINGVETYTSDNTYGTPVKGALMRVAKNDVNNKKNSAEIVVPSLMVASDYSAGLFVYGDRVYYATPNNVKNTSGVVENTYLSYQSAKLDGSDVQEYFSVSDNATVYRYVEVAGKVYLVYIQENELHSYDIAGEVDTLLAKNVGGYVLSEDKDSENASYIYYTMSVQRDLDKAGASSTLQYNQVYRVCVNATTAPYSYTFDQEYLDENDGVAPYINLGELVFDGIGRQGMENPTQYTQEKNTTPSVPMGYTYTLQSFENDGIYFTRKEVGESTAALYYLPVQSLASGWNSISGNDSDAIVKIAKDTTKAGTSALFYLDEGKHAYVYSGDANNLVRVDVASGEEVSIPDISGATLLSVDTTDSTYDYLYYTTAGTSGAKINRIVINGTQEDYRNMNLNYDEEKTFSPVQILDVEHVNNWYGVEFIGNKLFFAEANAYSATSFTYIATVDLNGANGVMNNIELRALNEKYDAVLGEDGYIAGIDSANLATAVRYYFHWGKDELLYKNNDNYQGKELNANGYLTYDGTVFAKNIAYAVDEGKKNTYLYSEEDQAAFKAYVEGGEDVQEILDYRTRSYFVTRLGLMNEADQDSLQESLKTTLRNYTAPAVEETPFPAWAWALIGTGIGLVVIGGGLAIFFILRSKKRKAMLEGSGEEKMEVDTTDDEEIDVYAEMDKDEESEEDENVLTFPTAEESVEESVEEAPVEEAPEETPVEGEATPTEEEKAPTEEN